MTKRGNTERKGIVLDVRMRLWLLAAVLVSGLLGLLVGVVYQSIVG